MSIGQHLSAWSTRILAVVSIGGATLYFMSNSDDATVQRKKEQGYAISPELANYRRKFMEKVKKKEESPDKK